jgi:hypothetical protein
MGSAHNVEGGRPAKTKIAPSPFQPLPRIYPSPPPPLRPNTPHGPVPAHVSRGKGPYPVPFQFHLLPPLPPHRPLYCGTQIIPQNTPVLGSPGKAPRTSANSCWWRGRGPARVRVGVGESRLSPPHSVRWCVCGRACAATAHREPPPARLLRVVRHIFTPPPALLTPFPAVATAARISKRKARLLISLPLFLLSIV